MSKKQKIVQKNKNWLDLACGNNLQLGFTGVDRIKRGTQADIELNLLQFPWPFKDNSIEKVFCSHFLEHIPHGDGFHDPFFNFFTELYRIMKKDGTATFVIPYYTSMRAFQDPSHQRYIGEATFLYLSKKWLKMNKLSFYPIDCNFEVIGMNHAVSEEFNGRAQEAIQYAGLHSWNVINDIIVTLKKI